MAHEFLHGGQAYAAHDMMTGDSAAEGVEFGQVWPLEDCNTRPNQKRKSLKDNRLVDYYDP